MITNTQQFFTINHLEPNKSDETSIISNIDFLTAIFGNNTGNACSILVSFKGNPANVEKQKWRGRPWTDTSTLTIPNDANNYFSLAVFNPNESGEYRRRKSQFQGLYAIMLDDIGTKVPLERLTLPPSWLLETSPENYQAGYILAEPIAISKLADQLMSAIINAGLCDPGANGPTARLARLPVAINSKHDPSFKCQLKFWAPGKRYSISELINGLQLEIIESEKHKRKRNQTENNSIDFEQIWTPCPKENAVLTALKYRNLYKQPLGEGKHDLTCPWLNEHTNSTDSGTAYFEPDDNYPLGGFKCQHGHCSNKHIQALLRYLDVDINLARMKPTIRVIKGEIHRIVDIAERQLAASYKYYQRGSMIVSVCTDPSSNETYIQEVSQPSLVRALSGTATWEQYDGRSKCMARIDPPDRHTRVLYNADSYRHLPIINGIARQPYLRVDGSIMHKAGYDPSTGMFGVFNSRKFLLQNEPTREHAEEALKLLNGLLDEFCFLTQEDHSAALSAILTAAIRPSLANALMIHVRAHTASSGKSYLCSLITAFATPQRGTPTTFPADDEECRKLLLAEFLKAPAVIEFDNITSDILPYKSLCTALTSEFMSGRILGSSKIATVSTRTLILSSGNNIAPIKDMARRCITINLYPQIEIPAARTFKRPNLISELLREREYYVSAAINIIRAWIIAGKPRTKCKSLAGFGDWSDFCRQPLLWLGYPDPAASIFNAIKEDPDRELLGRLLSTWQSTFGNTPTMIREAVNISTYTGAENNELIEVLHDIADERGHVNRHRLGRWIQRHEGQIVDGQRFMRSSGITSTVKWKVESVSTVSSLFKAEEAEIVKAADAYRRASSGE